MILRGVFPIERFVSKVTNQNLLDHLLSDQNITKSYFIFCSHCYISDLNFLDFFDKKGRPGRSIWLLRFGVKGDWVDHKVGPRPSYSYVGFLFFSTFATSKGFSFTFRCLSIFFYFFRLTNAFGVHIIKRSLKCLKGACKT